MCDMNDNQNDTNSSGDKSNELNAYNMTRFQSEWCAARQAKEDFDRWIHTRGLKNKKRSQGSLVMPYYTKDGKFHAVRLGVKEVLAEAIDIAATVEDADGKGTSVTVYVKPRQPGKSWNEQQVKFEAFRLLFVLSHTIDSEGNAVCLVADHGDWLRRGIAFLEDNALNYTKHAQ